MLLGHANGLSELRSSKDQLLADPEALEDDFKLDSSEPILYAASFEELARNYLQYDTIIWVSISLLLVLAWGVGIIMLLYLPFRRYVSRPSFIPFWGTITMEKHVPLSKVIDIIIEQGWLQSVYGIHTFRVESIAHGKAAPVDELQASLWRLEIRSSYFLQVIVRETAKAIQEVGKSWKLSTVTTSASPRHSSMERRATMPGELVMQKLDEVTKSVKKIEFLIEKSQASSEGS
ncbi:digalactosyldiacylglycerol synthase 2 [Hibiscus syriacus]|uniref:Digalactosyldiacylglycerol synthase 2 n=1 Tax=Hibiscus syriacus TaxID=106335 RepID=A0A6A3A1S1_HIBSY|nr:digalactosyldiacylglycerol synthase 2 [Hibiscus syriacus]